MTVPPEPPPEPITPQQLNALVELVKMISLVVALGVASLWQNTFGAFFTWLGGALNFKLPHTNVRPLGWLAHNISAAASYTQHFFSSIAVAHEGTGVSVFVLAAKTQKQTTTQIGDLSDATAATLDRQQKVFLPWFVSTKTGPLHKAIGATNTTAKNAKTTADSAAKTAGKTATTTVKPVTATQARTTPRVGTKLQTATYVGTIPQTIAHVNTRVGTLERWEAGAKHDLTWLKDRFKSKTFAASVAAALGVLGLSFLRKGCVKRTLGGWCKIDPRVFDALLAGLALVTISEGLVPFARAMQGVIGDAEGLVRHFWKATAPGKGGNPDLGDVGLG